MLKRILVPIIAILLLLSPLTSETKQKQLPLKLTEKNSAVIVSTTANSKFYGPAWWKQLADFVKAYEHALLQAWYDAISIPYHTGTYNGYACGGDLPSCCTVAIESHGNPYAVNPGHSGAPYGDPGDPWTHASGLVQFMPGTWNGYHGYAYAAAAPVHDQYLREAEVFNHGSGASNWFGDGCYNGG